MKAKDFFKACAIQVIICIFVSIMFMLLVINAPLFGQEGAVYNFYVENIKINYDEVANSWSEDPLIQTVSYFCSDNNELKEVFCINRYVKENFNYTNHGLLGGVRKNPKELMEVGGVCRDWSIFYAAILKNLNISYEYQFEVEGIFSFKKRDGHVFIYVYPEGYSCFLDQTTIWCGDDFSKTEVNSNEYYDF